MPRSVGSVDAKVLSDRYEILAPLGAGTAATVYRVRDRRTGVLRAAKVLTPENAANSKILARFEDEFRILRTLHHPHLPEVYDYGWTEGGGRFLVMELVDGVPLDEYFRSNPTDIWAILYELCETLTFIHDHKLLHQDIKPSNILVKRTTAYGPDLPLVKLIDFGLIYRRDTGAEVELVGTPEYIAPEIARGNQALTRAVDYYSLGVTLYELLVGHPPFQGPESKVLRAHVEQQPVIENEELEWAELYPHVRALLTKDSRARLEAFEEFRRAVVSRLTGGIEELDRAYKVARAPQVTTGIERQWRAANDWLGAIHSNGYEKAPALDIQGPRGPERNALLDTVCAESAIRGFHVVRLVDDAKDVLQADGTMRQVERFDRVIARLQESPAVLLVIDAIEQLGDEPVGFVRYLSTKRELAADRAAPVFLAVARRWPVEHPLDPYLPADRTTIELPSNLKGVADEERTEDSTTSFSIGALLDGDRSVERRQLLAYVASHPLPVPIEWVREFSGLSPEEFDKDLDPILTLHLATKVTFDGSEALTIPEDARQPAREIVSRQFRSKIHRDLADRLTDEMVSSGRSLSGVYNLSAYHLAAITEHRAATIADIRAVKSAWSEGSLSRVERLAETALERLDHLQVYASAARRHFVKQWVNALWAKNQHTRAKRVMEEYVIDRGDAISPTLLPKYIRGILDANGPVEALKFYDGISSNPMSPRARQQLALERALILWHSARHEESQRVLAELGKGNDLANRDRHRAVIYEAMNLADLGDHKSVEMLLARASQHALADRAFDELVLMSAIRAQSRTLQGSPHEALRVIAQTMRVAHKRELYLRLNVLYRLAATAYRDLGQPQKAVQAQRKALALASSLGLVTNEAMSWSRLAEYEQAVGQYGNALRYAAKAKSVMGTAGSGTDRASLDLLTLHLHTWLRSPDVDAVIRGMQWVQQVGAPNERGRYFMMMAMVHMDRGDWMKARRFLNKATIDLERAGIVDNLISVRRASMRLNVVENRNELAQADYIALNSRNARTAKSAAGRLERNLALLEFHYARRSSWKVLAPLCESCLRLVEESTEARLKVETLIVVFRAFARNSKYDDAEATFSKLWPLLKTISGNLPDRYVAGALERVETTRLAHELDLLRKRDKAGVTTSLVA